ncbi:MAG: phosphoribosylglycinamide formyltransferase [Pseudomonadota bacterium]
MSHLRVAIFISGGGSNMLALVESMVGDHPARPCMVLSNDPLAAGLDRAAQLGVPTAAVDHRPFCHDRVAFETELTKILSAAKPDILCLAGFMRVLTASFVDQWAGRMLNIHPSLLPKHKGLNTHARALDAGDREHGCTVHQVTAALDDGPVLGQARLSVRANDTPQTLAARVLKLEHRLYPAVLRRFSSGNHEPVTLSEPTAS